MHVTARQVWHSGDKLCTIGAGRPFEPLLYPATFARNDGSSVGVLGGVGEPTGESFRSSIASPLTLWLSVWLRWCQRCDPIPASWRSSDRRPIMAGGRTT